MAKNKTQGRELKIVESEGDTVEIPKIAPAPHIHPFQASKDEMYYPATGFQLRQLSKANARVTAFSSTATFFLASAITLGVGALQSAPPDKLWLPYLLGGFSLLSVALTVWFWIYRGQQKGEVDEIISEIMAIKSSETAYKS